MLKIWEVGVVVGGTDPVSRNYAENLGGGCGCGGTDPVSGNYAENLGGGCVGGRGQIQSHVAMLKIGGGRADPDPCSYAETWVVGWGESSPM